ncbi:MAG: hypothetical protein B7Z44_03785 [Caulobacter sp. 12-67-6]|nr:MAG: hypothetical protein B7Z44_03785 [Caulobacter sp. 12-67-6]OYX73169.1 MAG: hypothetical protein B7Y81_03855 [Caulobacter sp. 32-67-35]
MRLIALSAAAPLLLATPALAAPTANRLTVGDVFGNAAAPVQLIILLLAAAIVAAPILLVLRRPAALSALAKGAPLLAGAAALFTLLAGAVGIANSPVVPSLTVLAPGLAEMLFLMVLGLLATFSAVVCRELAKPRNPTLIAAE